MAIDYAALANEINADPNAYGYAARAAVGDDQGIADLLNLKRAGITVRRPSVRREELMEAIDTRDLKANPTVLEGSLLESILQSDTVFLANPDNTVSRTRQNLNRLLADTNLSQTRLAALANEQGSRAQQLFGYATNVTPSDVAKALRG